MPGLPGNLACAVAEALLSCWRDSTQTAFRKPSVSSLQDGGGWVGGQEGRGKEESDVSEHLLCVR